MDDTVKTNYEWIASLDPLAEGPLGPRKTSIICTIGPNTNNVEMMNKLRDAGMNIVRMNFSHGSHEYHSSVIENARKSCEDYPGRTIAIALDTKGPEIRTGMTRDGKDYEITKGHEMIFSVDDKHANSCDLDVMYVDYKNLPKVIEIGRIIYVDDGVLSFKVLEVNGTEVKVRCLNNGKISSRKGVNLPKTDVDLPALSEKDKKDLLFGVDQGVDMIFASFIRRAQDVIDIREILGEAGKHIKIIVKIENHQGVVNFDEILRVTDGVMIARGDLGIEIPIERVFIAQKMMIAKCNLVGKPVICATQMLESMTYNPRPTRAEVSDVANAVLDGADCVMLSGETAKGSYPIEAVKTMHETCILAESAISYGPLNSELRSLTPRPTETTETVASAAVSSSYEQNAGAIIVLSTSGNTARLVSKYRPRAPIIVVTRNPQTSRHIHLYRGCYPLVYPRARPAISTGAYLSPAETKPWQEDVDARIMWAISEAIKDGLLKHGQPVVAVQGWRGGLGNTNTMRILLAP